MDSNLLRRIYTSEATAAFATALSLQAQVDHNVAVEALGDGVLVAFGPGRYVNRAIGVGPRIEPSDVAAIEHFYKTLDLPASVQISSAATSEALDLLTTAGFRPAWFRGVHAAALPMEPRQETAPGSQATAHRIVAVDASNLDQWVATLAVGNQISSSTARSVSDEFALAMHRAVGSIDSLVLDSDDTPIACGSVHIADGVAWLGGAATTPAVRSQGVQTALIRHRLQVAADNGCVAVAATAMPHTTSARNLVRAGLGLIDTQLVLIKG